MRIFCNPRGSGNYRLAVIFVNTILLGQGLPRWFIYCLWLLSATMVESGSCSQESVPHKPSVFSIQPFTENSSQPLIENIDEFHFSSLSPERASLVCISSLYHLLTQNKNCILNQENGTLAEEGFCLLRSCFSPYKLLAKDPGDCVCAEGLARGSICHLIGKE